MNFQMLLDETEEREREREKEKETESFFVVHVCRIAI